MNSVESDTESAETFFFSFIYFKLCKTNFIKISVGKIWVYVWFVIW